MAVVVDRWDYFVFLILSLVSVLIFVENRAFFYMMSSPYPFRTDRQKFKMTTSVDENSQDNRLLFLDN